MGAYLDRLDPNDSRGAVELIYRDYCLAAAAGRKPDSTQYVCRFPRYAGSLERLLGMHEACSPSALDQLVESVGGDQDQPRAGDTVGPFFLRRELGRGSFARVFLAEQISLEDRLVVVKVATRARHVSPGCWPECAIPTSSRSYRMRSWKMVAFI